MTQTPTQKLFDFVMKCDKLFYLKDRWSDERDYEDFAEYRDAIKAIFANTGYSVKAVSQSFKITIIGDNTEFEVTILATKVKISSRPLQPIVQPKEGLLRMKNILAKADATLKKPRGIGNVVRELINAGKSNSQILSIVKSVFPEAKTNDSCVNWYRNQLKKSA